jgi:methyl-accepting chemotaxis protein WspA
MLADGLNSTADRLGELIGQIQRTGIQVNSSVTEMAATLKEQQASSSEVASTTLEIGATAKEITATARELGKTVGEVATVSAHTARLAGSGQAGLSRLESTMRQILEAAATVGAKLAILNENTGNISAVVTTINKVADQTNLLSLNAAIEAEKAGEYGQGFSVVATEVRRLADQTAVATHDIEQMVKEMLSAVAAGVMGMDKFNEEVRRGCEEARQVTAQLLEIIEQVQAQTPRFEAVNDGMQSQATAAGQISDALGQLGETTQQSAEAGRQNAEAIEQLSGAARGLQEAVSRFNVG